MDVKGKVLLQLSNKSKLRNGIKMFLEPKFFSFCSQIKKIKVYCPFNGNRKIIENYLVVEFIIFN